MLTDDQKNITAWDILLYVRGPGDYTCGYAPELGAACIETTTSYRGYDLAQKDLDSGSNNSMPGSWTIEQQKQYTFEGFFSPIDMSTETQKVINLAKASQAIPIKWRLSDATSGEVISDPTSFKGLQVSEIACQNITNSSIDAIEEYTPGASGLQYLGDGNWQLNWKTPEKSGCYQINVAFDTGLTSPTAYFKLK